MSDSLDLLDALRSGRYMGEGVNHENQPFTGTLELRSVLGGLAWAFAFSAAGAGGAAFHEEESLLAASPSGAPCLVSVSTNDPLVRTYDLRRDETEGEVRRLTFGWGQPEAKTTYRCQITLELYPNDDLGYRFAWGMPGEAFAERSGVRLRASKER